MTTIRILPIDPLELDAVRATGRDRFGHEVETFVDGSGGSQLRCCLTHSRPGEEVALISHAPLSVDRPWREVGPVFIHARACNGYASAGGVPEWFDHAPRVLRAYDSGGAMRYVANRIVDAGSGVDDALQEVFADPSVSEVHVRNLQAQCFIARVVREP